MMWHLELGRFEQTSALSQHPILFILGQCQRQGLHTKRDTGIFIISDHSTKTTIACAGLEAIGGKWYALPQHSHPMQH